VGRWHESKRTARAASNPQKAALTTVILIFVVGMATSGVAQYPPAGTKKVFKNGGYVSVPAYRLYNGEVQTMDEIAETQKLINQIASNVGTRAFVKFSNGSTVYVGKLLSVRYGLISPLTYPGTNTVHTNKIILIDYGYTVHDVTTEGCRITCDTHPWQPDYKDIFVVGLTGYSDRKYDNILMLRSLGSYTYSAVSGASRTIPKFEVGVPCTKEEYLEFVKKP
jgi:hypothetical protein